MEQNEIVCNDFTESNKKIYVFFIAAQLKDPVWQAEAMNCDMV